jgi:hypothetical protein
MMKDIKQLANQFREAIEVAKEEREFYKDIVFRNFPVGCCGDTCALLAQFMLDNDIEIRYVRGTYRDGSFEDMQSHAWLLTDNQIIIDITGDQFRYTPHLLNYNKSVYVGAENDFYRLFEVNSVDVYEGIGALGDGCQDRLKELYQKIMIHI